MFVFAALHGAGAIAESIPTSFDARFEQSMEEAGLEFERMLLPLDCSKAPDEPRLVDSILVHFCSDAMENPDSPYDTRRIVDGFRRFRVSAHVLIDREGKVIQMVSLDRTAYHAGVGRIEGAPERENRLNEYSIGIELMGIGTRSEMSPFMEVERYDTIDPKDLGYTDPQYDALNRVIASIRRLFPEIGRDRRSIFGHDEWSPGRKTDPGALFDWERIGLRRYRGESGDSR